MFKIRQLTVQDAAMFAKNASEIYLEVFKYLWQDEGRRYAAESFNPQTFKSEIESGEKLYFGVFSDDEMIGFLKLYPDGTLPVFAEKKVLELEKVYLSKLFHGKGIGKSLMDLSVKLAGNMGKEIVWLDVVAGNESAIRFYENLGFIKCGTSIIDFPNVKPEFSKLIVMQKILGAE